MAADGSFYGKSVAVGTGPFTIILRDSATSIHAAGGDSPEGINQTWVPKKNMRFAFNDSVSSNGKFTISEGFKFTGIGPRLNLKLPFQGVGIHGLEDQLPIANNGSNWARGVNIFGARVPKPGEILLARAETGLFPNLGLNGHKWLQVPFTCIPGRETEHYAVELPEHLRPHELPADVDVSNAGVAYQAHWKYRNNTIFIDRELFSKVKGPADCGENDAELIDEVLKQAWADSEPSIMLDSTLADPQ